MSEVTKLMRSAAIENILEIDDATLEKVLPMPVLYSYKLDGIRVGKPKAGDAISKSGKPVPNKFIRKWLREHCPVGFDTEIGVGNPTSDNFYWDTYSAYTTHEGEPDFNLYVFDMCDRNETFALERYKTYMAMQGLPSRIVKVEKKLAHTAKQLKDAYIEALAAGYEGLVIQATTGFYKNGKATLKAGPQWKAKPEEDAEAVIVDVLEAMHNTNEAFLNELGETVRSSHQENKVPAGRAGVFLATDCATGELIRIGSGRMKHDEAKLVLENKADYIGRTFTYVSMAYGVKDAPRQGRWKRWRSPVDMEAVPNEQE